MIAISEFARIERPDIWDHGRNPVRYTSLEELGIDLGTLRFEMMTQQSAPMQVNASLAALGTHNVAEGKIFTIAEAKQALAATFGVKPEAVEITIRG